MAVFFKNWALHPSLREEIYNNFKNLLSGYVKNCGVSANILVNN